MRFQTQAPPKQNKHKLTTRQKLSKANINNRAAQSLLPRHTVHNTQYYTNIRHRKAAGIMIHRQT